MNSNWRNRPTTIDYIPKTIDYIIGMDESGTSNLKQVQKAKMECIEPVGGEKHFTGTACAIRNDDFETARDMVMKVKYKYWKDALFYYKGSNKRVCFHSREIRGRKEAFNPEIVDYCGFITDSSRMMENIPITLYASHIDKWKHINQYLYLVLPYDLCMTFVLGRIVRDMDANSTAIIVLVSRGRNEDREILEFIKNVLDHGTRFLSADSFRKIQGVYFNPKWCKIAEDQKSYWELELAYLCAYPFYKYFVYGTVDEAYKTLLPKLSNYPNYLGKGLKSFP